MASNAYLSVLEELDQSDADSASARFNVALDKLRQLAEAADIDACEALAEILCTKPLHSDPAAAYRWYYVALSQQGYSVAFRDLNHTPPHYGGEVGDFRNESMVSDLVSALGFDKVQQLDVEAAAWLSAHGLQPKPRSASKSR